MVIDVSSKVVGDKPFGSVFVETDVEEYESVTSPDPDPCRQSSSSQSFSLSLDLDFVAVTVCFVGGTYTGVIRSSPLPFSKGGMHSSSSSPRHPEPAPENIRSSITPG